MEIRIESLIAGAREAEGVVVVVDVEQRRVGREMVADASDAVKVGAIENDSTAVPCPGRVADGADLFPAIEVGVIVGRGVLQQDPGPHVELAQQP